MGKLSKEQFESLIKTEKQKIEKLVKKNAKALFGKSAQKPNPLLGGTTGKEKAMGKKENSKNGIFEIPSAHGGGSPGSYNFVHVVIAPNVDAACYILARQRAIEKIKPKHPDFDPDCLAAQHIITGQALGYLKRKPVQVGETSADPAVVEINRAKQAGPESSTLH